MLNRKGMNFALFTGLIIAIIILVIGAAIGSKVITTLKTDGLTTITENFLNRPNASDTSITTGSYTLQLTNKPLYLMTSLTNKENTSLTLNYTVSSLPNAQLSVTAYNWNTTALGKNVTATYSYGIGTAADNANKGLIDFASFLPVMGTIIGAIIIISIVYALKR